MESETMGRVTVKARKLIGNPAHGGEQMIELY
jgi:hypothetical protein